jgi:hypothetical protein
MPGSIFCDNCRLEAEREAKAMVDRELMEAIYILLRHNQLAQENASFAVGAALKEMKKVQQGRSK